MKTIFLILLIGGTHSFYIFGMYASKFFGLLLPYWLALALWLFVPALLAEMAYFYVIFKHMKGINKSFAKLKSIILSVLATLTTLYIGVFSAFNAYGT